MRTHALTGRTLLQLWLLEVLGLGMGARWRFSAPEGEAATGAAVLGSFFLVCFVALAWVTVGWMRRRAEH